MDSPYLLVVGDLVMASALNIENDQINGAGGNANVANSVVDGGAHGGSSAGDETTGDVFPGSSGSKLTKRVDKIGDRSGLTERADELVNGDALVVHGGVSALIYWIPSLEGIVAITESSRSKESGGGGIHEGIVQDVGSHSLVKEFTELRGQILFIDDVLVFGDGDGSGLAEDGLIVGNEICGPRGVSSHKFIAHQVVFASKDQVHDGESNVLVHAAVAGSENVVLGNKERAEERGVDGQSGLVVGWQQVLEVECCGYTCNSEGDRICRSHKEFSARESS